MKAFILDRYGKIGAFRLRADVVIDDRKQDFATALDGYDVVLNSLGTEALEKPLEVLKSGRNLIWISGRPVVDQIFPFLKINEAMDYLATGRVKGKVVINVK
jgi:NADPH:quinone reductase-like Zn-dependent oxidoreductase